MLKYFFRIALIAVVLGWYCAPAAVAQEMGTSPTCGPVSGKSKADLAHVLSFCEKGVTEGLTTAAYAMESLLWVKVSREIADAFVADRMRTEQLMKTWMRGWKQESGRRAVTIYVEWGDVEVARGETTLFSGDKITVRR